jgi:hypothetical protein
MIKETWLPSRCLAMDGRFDLDIPVFSGTPQYIKVMTVSYKVMTQELSWQMIRVFISIS